ncbi:MAG: hypothetical protein B0W54_12755 [Cellvibrio sp. 79]|nr:MAG: hypothetical protein B0W54_12755 [Cellvibrio sp. 79]
MRINPTPAYWEFVKKALEGGVIEVKTIDHAMKIMHSFDKPIAIKILYDFDEIYRLAYINLCIEAESRGMWVIRGEATFLEPNIEFKIINSCE